MYKNLYIYVFMCVLALRKFQFPCIFLIYARAREIADESVDVYFLRRSLLNIVDARK